MQMFGVGALEMMVIMIVAVIVVGPERLPQVAGDLARWLNRARAYARHLTSDFNEVVSELEKEVGTSREDWKEISESISSTTSEVTREVEAASSDLKAASTELQSMDLEEAKREKPVAIATADANASAESEPDDSGDSPDAETDNAEGEQPWYATERAGRRRSRE